MAMNFDIDTRDLEPVGPAATRLSPPVDLVRKKSPFYVSQLPSLSSVSYDQIRNFETPQIPQQRISPPPPLTLSSAAINATPAPATVPVLIQTTPAPTIAVPLATVPTGYTFSFFQVRLPVSSTATINNYKVYRSTTNNSATASVIHAIPHNPASVGQPVVVQDAQPNGVTMFYWVSAINISGVESSLTPAQSASVTSNAGFNSNSQIASSFHNNPANTSFSPSQGVTLQNNGLSSLITVSSNVNILGSGNVSYNSASVAPGSFGTWYVFVDDPTFSGGALPFLFSTGAIFQLFSDARIPYGKILTASGGTGTSGGGTTGGTTQTSSPSVTLVGVRGISQ